MVAVRFWAFTGQPGRLTTAAPGMRSLTDLALVGFGAAAGMPPKPRYNRALSGTAGPFFWDMMKSHCGRSL